MQDPVSGPQSTIQISDDDESFGAPTRTPGCDQPSDEKVRKISVKDRVEVIFELECGDSASGTFGGIFIEVDSDETEKTLD